MSTPPIVGSRQSTTWREQERECISGILDRLNNSPAVAASSTRQDERATWEEADSDALIMKPIELQERLASAQSYPGPIFVNDLDDLVFGHHKNGSGAIEDFLNQLPPDSTLVPVQGPSETVGLNSNRSTDRRIGQLKEAAWDTTSELFPFNVLDMHSARHSQIRPRGFASANCDLLPTIQGNITAADPAIGAKRNPASIPAREAWVCFSNGGLTRLHSDSHGMSTFLTINSGRLGFVWWSRPTTEDLRQWAARPLVAPPQARMCCKILETGWRVFMPPGLVHAVYRLQDGTPTLITGGHILRYVDLAPWAQACALQMEHPATTNEDVSDIPEWIWQAARILATDKKETQIWGGADAADVFWEQAKVNQNTRMPTLPD